MTSVLGGSVLREGMAIDGMARESMLHKQGDPMTQTKQRSTKYPVTEQHWQWLMLTRAYWKLPAERTIERALEEFYRNHPEMLRARGEK